MQDLDGNKKKVMQSEIPTHLAISLKIELYLEICQ